MRPAWHFLSASCTLYSTVQYCTHCTAYNCNCSWMGGAHSDLWETFQDKKWKQPQHQFSCHPLPLHTVLSTPTSNTLPPPAQRWLLQFGMLLRVLVYIQRFLLSESFLLGLQSVQLRLIKILELSSQFQSCSCNQSPIITSQNLIITDI